jgi:NADP-dependent 3-hydroxy acid dehydrogenase YdfG
VTGGVLGYWCDNGTNARCRRRAAAAVSARQEDRLPALAARIQAAAGRPLAQPGDIELESEAERSVAMTVQRFGHLDILINAAGIIHAGSVEEANIVEWRRVMDVNVFGTLYACKAAIPYMRARGRGDITNISSTASRRLALTVSVLTRRASLR